MTQRQIPPLRILMLVTKFDPSGKRPYLTDELCEALVADGHSVDVLFLDWNREVECPETTQNSRLRVHVIPPAGSKNSVVSKVIQWTFSSFRVAKFYREKFPCNSHDILISFSPSIVFSAALFQLRPRIKFKILVQWDFFPFHQAQIGVVPFRWLVWLGTVIETSLLNTFNYIGCMSPRNVAYLQQRYKLLPDVRAGVLPIWAKVRPKPLIEKSVIRARYGMPENAFIAVFGGQIAAGRGIEDLVETARLAQEKSLPICIVVLGSGPKTAWLTAASKGLPRHLLVLPPLPREHYLELIASCNVGLVLTVPNVDVPSFPSKTLDYCCVALPIAAAVEKTTDYGEFIASAGFGRFCEAGNPSAFLEIIEELVADAVSAAMMGECARSWYENYFDVRRVAATLVKLADDDQEKK